MFFAITLFPGSPVMLAACFGFVSLLGYMAQARMVIEVSGADPGCLRWPAACLAAAIRTEAPGAVVLACGYVLGSPAVQILGCALAGSGAAWSAAVCLGRKLPLHYMGDKETR